MFLSSTCSVAVFRVVVVPCTVRSPVTVASATVMLLLASSLSLLRFVKLASTSLCDSADPFPARVTMVAISQV